MEKMTTPRLLLLIALSCIVAASCRSARCQDLAGTTNWKVQKLAVGVHRYGGGNSKGARARGGTIFIIDTPGSTPRQLVHGGYSAFSPDGTKIAYCTMVWNFDRGQIEVIGADGSGRTELTHVRGGLCDPGQSPPDWSPDGEKLAIAAYGGRKPMVEVMGKNGDNLTTLTEGVSPRWSPDGNQLSFCRTVVDLRNSLSHAPRSHNSIWVINADGTGEKKLWDFPQSTRFYSCATWLPDGKGVAFSLCDARNQTQFGCSQPSPIVRVNLDGNGPEEIASDERFELFNPLFFSPDGKVLLATGQPTYSPAEYTAKIKELSSQHGQERHRDLFARQIVSFDLASHEFTAIAPLSSAAWNLEGVVWQQK